MYVTAIVLRQHSAITSGVLKGIPVIVSPGVPVYVIDFGLIDTCFKLAVANYNTRVRRVQRTSKAWVDVSQTRITLDPLLWGCLPTELVNRILAEANQLSLTCETRMLSKGLYDSSPLTIALNVRWLIQDMPQGLKNALFLLFNLDHSVINRKASPLPFRMPGFSRRAAMQMLPSVIGPLFSKCVALNYGFQLCDRALVIHEPTLSSRRLFDEPWFRFALFTIFPWFLADAMYSDDVFTYVISFPYLEASRKFPIIRLRAKDFALFAVSASRNHSGLLGSFQWVFL